MKQQIAIYLRLSLEDVDKRTNKVKDESNSIASQRLLINRHLDQNPLLCDLPRIEFCDDGFSGTNFDRPDFSRMIEYAKRARSVALWSKTSLVLDEITLRSVIIWSISFRSSESASCPSTITMTVPSTRAKLSAWILPSKISSTTITAKTSPRRLSLQWE